MANPAGNLGTAAIRKPSQLRVVGNRHNARHHRDIDAELLYAVDETKVSIRIIEILGHRRISARVDLALKIMQVDFGVNRFWMKLRIGSNLDMKSITPLLAQKLNQLIGVRKISAVVTAA